MTEFKPLDPAMSSRQFAGLRRNVENEYASASPAQRQSGQEWYPKAHDLATKIGSGDNSRGAGVLAALSPQTRWGNNIRQAHELVGMHAHEVEALKRGDRTPLVGKVLNRAPTDRILRAVTIHEGEDPKNVLPMKIKTGNFYQNIHDPSDTHAVTVDVHAHDVAVGRKLQQDTNRGLSAVGRYNRLADVYRGAASRLGVERPHEIQATTWESWRDRVGGKHGES